MTGDNEVRHGLEGVVAVETEIAEPDPEGSAARCDSSRPPRAYSSRR